MPAMQGRCALVTGGGTGIGKATAERFAAEGAKVVICGRREAPLRKVSESHADGISYVRADIANTEDRAAALRAVLERHGRLDVLVNNAAAEVTAPFVDHTRDQMEHLVYVDLTAPMLFIHEALPELTKSRGNVVNVSSAAARYQGMPPANLAPYSAAKAGLNHLTRVLATELGPLGVRVNAVSPGFTDTEMSDMIKDPQIREAITSITPLGRVGFSEDVARVIFFLASDEADWVTGQIVDATGGLWLST